MKHKSAKALPEKVSKLTASEFFSLVERCSSICQQDLRLPEDIRSKFSSFDFNHDVRISEANLVHLILIMIFRASFLKSFIGMLRNIT